MVTHTAGSSVICHGISFDKCCTSFDESGRITRRKWLDQRGCEPKRVLLQTGGKKCNLNILPSQAESVTSDASLDYSRLACWLISLLQLALHCSHRCFNRCCLLFLFPFQLPQCMGCWKKGREFFAAEGRRILSSFVHLLALPFLDSFLYSVLFFFLQNFLSLFHFHTVANI